VRTTAPRLTTVPFQMVSLAAIGVGLLLCAGGCPVTKTEAKPWGTGPGPQTVAPTPSPQPADSDSQRREFLAIVIDGTSFADTYWSAAVQTCAEILLRTAKPGCVVCVMDIDKYSYEEANVLLGPEQLSNGSMKMHIELKSLVTKLKALPKPARQEPGTDIAGALHLLSDYVGHYPNCWLNLVLCSDLVEDCQPVDKLGAAPRLPDATRMLNLFVLRSKSETEYRARQADWVSQMAAYGIQGPNIQFLDPRQSTADNLPSDVLKSLRTPPA